MIKYAITDPSIYSIEYLKNLENRADWVLFRDKITLNYKEKAIDFIKKCSQYKYKKLLHQDYTLAKELNAFGVHLTSAQFNDIEKAKSLGLYTIISTHTFDEILRAQKHGADAVTFSPIFDTPNKGKAKGIEMLKRVINSSNMKVIALGGIVSDKEVNLVKDAGAFAFASIRYFM